MRYIVIIALFTLVPMLTSCTVHEAVKGTGKGTTEIVEGAGRGTTDLGKGAVGAVKETTEATAQVITGRGDEAVESGKDAINATAEGIKQVVVQPVKGLEKGLQEIDKGIKKATGSSDYVK